VRVNMVDGQANLTFMTQHAPVREAIEAATSRLREMLGDSGINLGEVSVNVGSFSQQQTPSQDQPASSHTAAWNESHDRDGVEQVVPLVTTASRPVREDGGVVDLFA
jgi:flagellar hook-length control protein FliK